MNLFSIIGKVKDFLSTIREFGRPDLIRKGADFLASIDSDDEGLDDLAARILRQIADWMDGGND